MVWGMDFRPLAFEEHQPEDMRVRARAFRQSLQSRRTIRDFSPREIPAGILRDCLAAAHSAPSGANLQPWHFAVVRSAATKRRIREAAEDEERIFYEERAPEEWLEALKPFGTDWRKPFLETAPALIAVFQRNRFRRPDDLPTAERHYTQNNTIITIILGDMHHKRL